MQDPDRIAGGFGGGPPDPLRYTTPEISFDPHEKNGILCSLIPPGSRVLDVGCGTGSTLEALRDALGCEVLGVEPNLQRVEAARSRGLRVEAGLLEDLDVGEVGTFDVVLFLDVLEHLPDPSSALEATKPYLSDGGVVVASVPNVAHWTVRWDLLRGRFDYKPSGIMDATHLRWFTEKTFRTLFESVGYRVVDWRVSAGTWLPDYRTRIPWRWLGERRRARLVRRAARWAPHLFGCQHIVRATPDPATAGP